MGYTRSCVALETWLTYVPARHCVTAVQLVALLAGKMCRPHMDCTAPIARAIGATYKRAWPTIIERCADSVTGCSRRDTPHTAELASHAALTAVQLRAFTVVE